tara:strand:+ start:600 stop:719 length:120 start_codon:yes stop_codon:yes gene_type:complete
MDLLKNTIANSIVKLMKRTKKDNKYLIENFEKEYLNEND